MRFTNEVHEKAVGAKWSTQAVPNFKSAYTRDYVQVEVVFIETVAEVGLLLELSRDCDITTVMRRDNDGAIQATKSFGILFFLCEDRTKTLDNHVEKLRSDNEQTSHLLRGKRVEQRCRRVLMNVLYEHERVL